MDKVTKEYALKYSVASTSKKTFHVGRFRGSQQMDFAKWPQPVRIKVILFNIFFRILFLIASTDMYRQEDPPKVVDESQQQQSHSKGII